MLGSKEIEAIIKKMRKRADLPKDLDISKVMSIQQKNFTIVAILDKKERVISMGCSKRCFKDQDDPNVGETIALSKALRNFWKLSPVVDLDKKSSYFKSKGESV